MVRNGEAQQRDPLKKHWQNYVKTWFNQPARKQRRRIGELVKRTAGPLRPIVQCQTLKYNMKSRAGRGFTLEELKAGDSTPEELATATQVQGGYMPITRGEKLSVEVVKVTDEMKSFASYCKLRLERMNKKHLGARQKRAAEEEKEEKK
uniref:60S ribosomal protein L13 n=1 Tax=Setaria italica TaxID=4555 RepID=K3ZXS1_SETIT